jgi:hypothetical protein
VLARARPVLFPAVVFAELSGAELEHRLDPSSSQNFSVPFTRRLICWMVDSTGAAELPPRTRTVNLIGYD